MGDRVNWLFIFSQQTSFFSSRCLPINSPFHSLLNPLLSIASHSFLLLLYATKFTLQRHKTRKFLSWKIEAKKWQNFYLLLWNLLWNFYLLHTHTYTDIKEIFFAYINLIIKPFFSHPLSSFLSNGKFLLDVVLHCAGAFYLLNLTKTLSLHFS